MTHQNAIYKRKAQIIAIDIARFRSECSSVIDLRGMALVAMRMVRSTAQADSALTQYGNPAKLNLMVAIDLIVEHLDGDEPVIGIDLNDISIPSFFMACALEFLRETNGYWRLNTPTHLNGNFVADALNLLAHIEKNREQSPDAPVVSLMSKSEFVGLQRRLSRRERHIKAEISALKQLVGVCRHERPPSN